MAERSGARADWMDVVSTATILVDTSFLMHQAAERALGTVSGQLLCNRANPMVVPVSVRKELLRNHTSQIAETRSRAETGLRLLSCLRELGVARLRGSTSDAEFADPVFLSKINEYRMRSNVIFLTQDQELAADVRHVDRQASARSRYRTFVLCATTAGEICYTRSARRTQPAQIARIFAESGEPVRAEDDEPLAAPTIGFGDLVDTDLGSLRMADKLADGGEGTVFRTERDDVVCKVYHPGALAKHRVAKLERMLSVSPEIPGVSWPLSLASSAGSVVGIASPFAAGRPIATEVFLPPILRGRHPTWSRRTLVGLARQLAETLRILHALGVVVGDLNPKNLLVTDAGEWLTFVDVDSFQIDGYPCPVGMVTFTAPELQGQPLSGRLRTIDHDLFALATMVFMLLMPGKPPFSQQGGGDAATNIREGHFPYPFGDSARGQQPMGPWRTVWSNFPYKIKEAFNAVFADGIRLSPEQWIDVLDGYLYGIDQGYFTDDLFPVHFKGISAHVGERYGIEPTTGRLVQVQCEGCGDAFPADEHEPDRWRYGGRTLCAECAPTSGSQLVCGDCASAFLFSDAEQALFAAKSWSAPRRCKACRNRRTSLKCVLCRQVFPELPEQESSHRFRVGILCYRCASRRGDERGCADCHRTFTITFARQSWLEDRGFDLPKRCEACRATRRRTN
jgi:rRNA-processing protein FCF1